MIPGIGDVVSGTSEVVLGSAVLLKNGVGIAGALLVTGVVMIPVINMGILTLLYKGTAALIQPVSDKRIVEAISFTGEGYHIFAKDGACDGGPVSGDTCSCGIGSFVGGIK